MPTAGSVFAGIGGFDLALERVGFTVIWQVENDPGCNRILVRRFPGVARFADVRTVRADEQEGRTDVPPAGERKADNGDLHTAAAGHRLERPDLLVGGFPCQGLSVAGKRGGLADPRSALFFEFARLAWELCPPWLLIENVPGLASSHRGRDLAVLLDTLAQLDFDAELVTLDSRYTGGVPQRRERIFIVGHSRSAGPCPFPLFLELEGGVGHPAAGREAGKEVAPCLDGSPYADREAEEGRLIVAASLSAGSNPHSNAPGRRREDDENLVVGTLKQRMRGATDEVMDSLVAVGFRNLDEQSKIVGTLVGHGDPSRKAGINNLPIIANSLTGEGHDASEDGTGRGAPLIWALQEVGGRQSKNQVRRLIPLECERLQAFPDGWTCICGATEAMLVERGITEADWRLSDFRTLRLEGHTARCRCKDSPRYRALGNAVTVTVASWVLRIMLAAMVKRALEGR